MAGRNISVDPEALGSIRVLKTSGTMDVMIGRAAALATVHDCTPRHIYAKHLNQVKCLWKLPGDKCFAYLDELKKSIDGKTKCTKPAN